MFEKHGFRYNLNHSEHTYCLASSDGLELRVRFKVPSTRDLADRDPAAFEYLFRQVSLELKVVIIDVESYRFN